MTEWTDIKLLESPQNIQGHLSEVLGFQFSQSKALEVASCLKQGRLLFEAARQSSLEIKPLQIYYGVQAFASALVVARTKASLSAMPRSHGLKDVSHPNAKVEALKVEILENGVFQRFNDLISKHDGFIIDRHRTPIEYSSQSANSVELKGHTINLQSVLSRSIACRKVYKSVFNTSADLLPVSPFTDFNDKELIDIRVICDENIANIDDAKSLVEGLRAKYKFLAPLWFKKSENIEREKGGTIVEFCNLSSDILKEFSDECLSGNRRNQICNLPYAEDSNRKKFDRFPITDDFPPLAGNYSEGWQYYLHPVEQVNISEFSLKYIGCFMLSIMARYKPNLWMHSISSRVTQERGFDDRCIALVEMFLEDVLESYPKLVSKLIRHEVASDT